MTTFVLVPGACHGGWWYQPLVTGLQRAGHQAQALTLAGLGPEGLAGAGVVNLASHVAEVTAAVRAASPRDASGRAASGRAASGRDGQGVVLVGHSYGGSVVTGAADHVPERVRALVYLDAFVPNDGDSCWSMTNQEQRRWYLDGAGRSGLAVEPLPFFDLRARPHPLATLVQRSTLTGAWQSVPSKTYVAATGWPQGSTSPFAHTTDRLAGDPAWTVHRWDTRHNVLHDGPTRLLELLQTI